MSRAKIASRYALFAVAATAGNLLAQAAILAVYADIGALIAALGVGTVVGLVIKYELDRRYIFHFRSRTKKEHGRSFVLYSFSGMATTVIFWGSEIALHLASDGWPPAKYMGGAIGLAIGYVIKYQLDKRYAFRFRQDDASNAA